MFKRNILLYVISSALLVAIIAIIGISWFSGSPANTRSVNAISNKSASELAELKSTCGPAYIFNAKPVDCSSSPTSERICGPGQPPFYGGPAYIFNAKPVDCSSSPTSERICGPGQPPFYGCPAYIFNAKPVDRSSSPTSERVCGPGQPPFYGCPAYIFNIHPGSNLTMTDSEGE